MSNVPRQENKFFVFVAVIVLAIGVWFIILGSTSSTRGDALFGITLIYESLQIYLGRIPMKTPQ